MATITAAPSAADKVFAIPELAGMILLDLTFGQLLMMQQVSKTMIRMIKSSQRLRRLLHLEAAKGPTNGLNVQQNRTERVLNVKSDKFRMLPVKPLAWTSHCRDWLSLANSSSHTLKIGYNLAHLCYQAEVVGALESSTKGQYLGVDWRCMLPSQPPTKEMQVEVWDEEDGCCGAKWRMKNESGITLGQMFEAASEYTGKAQTVYFTMAV